MGDVGAESPAENYQKLFPYPICHLRSSRASAVQLKKSAAPPDLSGWSKSKPQRFPRARNMLLHSRSRFPKFRASLAIVTA